jgi:ATP-dependent RNA helicase DeaD
MFSKLMEKSMGVGILWLKVPTVKSVMKALRRRIAAAAVAALPGLNIAEADRASGEPQAEGARIEGAQAEGALEAEAGADGLSGEAPVSPFLAKVCANLIERLGAEKAVEALVAMSYGSLLDPARYSPITEYSEDDFADPGKPGARMPGGRARDERRPRARARGRDDWRGDGDAGRPRDFGGERFQDGRGQGDRFSDWRKPGAPGKAGRAAPGARRPLRGGSSGGGGMEDFVRLYVGQGRQHGAGAREIAAYLMRAGGVPGRMVDEIEMKDFCSFATLPADAARRACDFSRRDPKEPVVRPASARGD